MDHGEGPTVCFLPIEKLAWFYKATEEVLKLTTFSAYCNTLEMMINEKIEALLALREKARNFKESLVDEDAKSRLLTRRN